MKTLKPLQQKRGKRFYSSFLAFLWFLFSVLGTCNFSFAYCGSGKMPAQKCCCGQKLDYSQACPANSPSKKVVPSSSPSSCPCNLTPARSSQEERLRPLQPIGSYSVPEQSSLLPPVSSTTLLVAIYSNPLHPQLIPSDSFLRSPPQE